MKAVFLRAFAFIGGYLIGVAASILPWSLRCVLAAIVDSALSLVCRSRAVLNLIMSSKYTE